MKVPNAHKLHVGVRWTDDDIGMTTANVDCFRNQMDPLTNSFLDKFIYFFSYNLNKYLFYRRKKVEWRDKQT